MVEGLFELFIIMAFFLNCLSLFSVLYLMRSLYLWHKQNRKQLERLATMYGIKSKGKSQREIRNDLETLLIKRDKEREKKI